MAATQWQTAQFKAQVSKVTIASPPVVEFSLTDAQGNPVVGFENATSKSATAAFAQYPNLAFSIAKLKPRTDSMPSHWVSYMVTTVPSTPTGSPVATRPSTDNTGTLTAVAGSPGSYKYTFFRDITATKSMVDAMTFSGNNRKEDLGDLTYEPHLPHRLVIQISGAARGTGSNTPTGASVAPAVNLANAVNEVYDFIPATGAAIPAAQLTREDVNIDTCNVCHEKLAFHGGSGRTEVKYCVTCHTDQRGFGRAKATSTAGKFAALTERATVNAATGITSYSYTPDTYIADGEVSGDFTTLIHKIHSGTALVKDNYHYAGLAFNNKGFSKLGGGQRMCSTCHDSTVAQNADNFKNLPSRKACGSCHDGINWETGGGSTLADKAAATAVGAVVATSGHLARGQADDSKCAGCHTPEYNVIDHRMENITKNNPVILDGLATFTYDIKSAAVNSANDLVIEFGIKQRIAPSTTDTLVTLAAPAASVTASLAGYSGGPSFLLAYALPQDGVAMPVDYNNLGRPQAQPRSVSVAQLLSTNNAANGSLVASATAGYYVATIKGSGAWAFPVGATLRAVAMQGYYTQLNAPLDTVGNRGSVGRHAISVVKNITGDTVRRTVVDDEKCASCHEWFEGHGGNRVKETQVCVVCHVPGMATSGRGIPDNLLNTWVFDKAGSKILADWKFDKTLPNAALQFPVVTNNFKEMIHGIHAGRQRVVPFQDARDRSSSGVIQLLDFRRMDFPGKLNNCETCHVTAATAEQKTYNFIPNNALLTVDEHVNAGYAAGIANGTATPALAKASLATQNATDLVLTPYAGACVSCHDNNATKAHIRINGGQMGVPRSSASALNESCAVCHGPGSNYDTVAVHK